MQLVNEKRDMLQHALLKRSEAYQNSKSFLKDFRQLFIDGQGLSKGCENTFQLS